MTKPEEILAFWLDAVGPDGWYKKDDALDATIRERFGAALDGAMQGRHALWLTYPGGVLAYIILTDQFPRNMFRDDPRAFSSDAMALAAAKQAIVRNWDLKIDEPARVMFYMPLEHSERLCDQDRAVRLIKERMPNTGAGYLLHARVHREIIRQFGRFPYRNAVLGRVTSPAEERFFESGGYGAILRAFEGQAAA